MHSFVSIENFVFDNLDNYINKILEAFESSKVSDKKFIKLVEQEEFSVFFLHTEVLTDLLLDGKGLEKFETLKNEGFFILIPTKITTVIGRTYEVCYCKNNTRIISKNLTRFGYVFITKTEDVARSEDQLLLCNVVKNDSETINARRRLIELTPGLFLFFNSKSSHQALLVTND